MDRRIILTGETAEVVLDGKPYSIRKGGKEYQRAKAAADAGKWDLFTQIVCAGKGIEKWSKGAFKFEGDHITFAGERVEEGLEKRMVEMALEDSDPSHLMKFYERLQENPSNRSVNQLYAFLQHDNIPINKDGMILAYKGVKADFKDCHSGKFDNKPGNKHEMKRNKISDDPTKACDDGFHVGSLSYATGFGAKTVIVKVDPADVVCVPNDCSQQKVRVCKYEVIGLYGKALPSSTHDEPAAKAKVEKEAEADIETMSLKQLRWHAFHVLKLENASRTPGGKDGLLLRVQHSMKQPKIKMPESPDTTTPWDPKDLMAKVDLDVLSIAQLRRYATHVLKIVGASRIRGGRQALIDCILEVQS